MSYYRITTSFEMKDGRELSCEYHISVDPFSYYYTHDFEVTEPVYFIDGNEISIDKLPKGLDVIAKALYDADIGEYNYKREAY